MTVVNSPEYLNHGVCCLLLWEELSLKDLFKEFSTRTEIRNDVEVLLVLVELIDANDVGVVELLEDFHLLGETLPLLLRSPPLRDDLYSPDCLRCAVDSLTYLPIGSLPNTRVQYDVVPWYTTISFLNQTTCTYVELGYVSYVFLLLHNYCVLGLTTSTTNY